MEIVNKNFKTISMIQKCLSINELTKKHEFKSVKMIHNNENEINKLSENFKILEEIYNLNELNKTEGDINNNDDRNNNIEDKVLDKNLLLLRENICIDSGLKLNCNENSNRDRDHGDLNLNLEGKDACEINESKNLSGLKSKGKIVSINVEVKTSSKSEI